MIRFSARCTYLLLVPQGMALILHRALISFLGNNLMFKRNFTVFILKRTITGTVTVTNADGECSVNVRDFP